VKHPARIGAALAAAAAIALGAAAVPALAGGGFTLNLSPQSEAVVGRSMIIQVTGTIPPDQVSFPYWLSLVAIPASVTPVCPAEEWQGQQFAADNGGSIVVLTARERPDAAGSFATSVAVTPTAPGRVLLCGYTDDGATLTLATASLVLDIKPAPSSPAGSGSRSQSPPVYTVHGIRSCRALLAPTDAKRCIRDIVRQANRRCRRLHTRHARVRCLRAVRRARRSA
jgi:hypothetical protein